MSIDTEALRARTDIVAVVSAYTTLKKAGAEYCGPCPIHGGDGNNFYVNPQKRIWACFSHNCHEREEGNDVIGFMQAVEGLSFKDACERLGVDTWKPAAPIPERAKPLPERVTCKPPADAPVPEMELKRLGKPARTWCYRDADGLPLMYVARYDTAEGKEIRCFSWAQRDTDDGPAWRCMHYNRGERPLYQLDRLAATPNVQVIVVEGEKAAEAAQGLLPRNVVTTWPGGAAAWKYANLEPLRGRSVLLWPDADQAGREAMEKLAEILASERGLGCKVKRIRTDGLPEGFDAADWRGEDILAWLKARAEPYLTIPPAPPQPPTEPQPEKPKRRLAVVSGNTVLAPEPDAERAPQPLSEDALADYFAEIHRDNWRRVAAWDKWFHWNGDGWAEDREDARVDPMRQIYRDATYWPEASNMSVADKRKMCRQAAIYSAIRLAGTDKRLRTTPDVWDVDPWMLGVPGGVVDLKAGKMLEASREQCITMRCTVAPENGTPELWLKLLRYWMRDDDDMVAWLRRYLGYALTGDNREQCMAFFYGPAQAGKGTIIRTVAGIMGSLQGEINPFRSYHYEAPISTFMESRSDRHSTELAALYGKRLITAEEPSAGAKWDEGKLKWITGGSQITARFVSRDNFSFTMTGKIIVAANHRPRLATTDNAIRRRLHVVPFENPISDEDRDNQLDAKLRQEWPRILNWMVEGCLEWQQAGLGLPERIAASTETYLESEDTLGSWLEDCCKLEGRAEAKNLYESYRKWCEGNGEHGWTRRAWANAMVERGFVPCRGTAGARMFQGASLKFTDYQPRYPGD